MSEEQQSALDVATSYVNGGNYAEALERARAILTTDPTNASAKLIEAISLSQLGNVADASEAFAEAVALDPSDVRVRYNAAVHENNRGNYGEARAYANDVLAADPEHSGAKELLARIDDMSQGKVEGAYQRVSAESMEVPYEGIALLRNHAGLWTAIGWGISALTFAFFCYFWSVIGPHFQEFVNAAQSQDQTASMKIAKGISNPLMSYGPYVLLFSNMIYMILDIVHRKGNFLWLIAHIPCTCCGTLTGGNFLTLPIYMLFGRK